MSLFILLGSLFTSGAQHPLGLVTGHCSLHVPSLPVGCGRAMAGLESAMTSFSVDPHRLAPRDACPPPPHLHWARASCPTLRFAGGKELVS